MPFFNSQTRKAAIRSLRNRMMESPGGVGRLISIVAGNCRVRLDAHDGFLLPDWRRGAATTARFSSRTSNRSGWEVFRGILPLLRRNFPAHEGGGNDGSVTILLPPRISQLDRFEKGLQRGTALLADENLAKAANQLRGSADSSRGDEKIHPSSWCRHWHRPCRRELPESQRSLLRNRHAGRGSRLHRKRSQGQAQRLAECFWPGRQFRSLVS
jgi:hypothetical protein